MTSLTAEQVKNLSWGDKYRIGHVDGDQNSILTELCAFGVPVGQLLETPGKNSTLIVFGETPEAVEINWNNIRGASNGHS